MRTRFSFLACSLTFFAGSVSAATFSNTTSLTIADAICNPATPGKASTYPSTIAVSNLVGTVSKVTVTLIGMNHAFQGDYEVMLVGPGGGAQNLKILSDAGTGPLSNATVTFDDAAAAKAPQNSAWTPGTYKPTDYVESLNNGGIDTFPAPAPTASSNTTFAATFNGINPNGTWSLYVTDDACGDAGNITGGWTLNITVASAAGTTTAVTSSLNPSRTGQSVTFTGTVTSSGNPVTTGTVTFTEGATTLAANVSVNASGQATFATSGLVEGDHVITCTYNGTASFASSLGSVNQRVDNNTTVVGNAFSNTGNIVLTDPVNGPVTPYPSKIFVTSLGGTVSHLKLTLRNVTHPFTTDIDALLVGPGGQKYIFLSDVGRTANNTNASNVTLVLDDAAPSAIPTDTQWGAANATVTSKPVAYAIDADTFGAPAPGAPYLAAAPQGFDTFSTAFNGGNPNGTWTLYLTLDNAGSGNGAIAGGWTLEVTTAGATATTTAVTSNQNPSFTTAPNNSVTITATVTSGASPVTTGTVTFTDTTTNSTLASNIALNGSGQATFTTTAFTERDHVIRVDYNGTASFAVSNGSVTQQVANHTTVVNNTYSNTGLITLNDKNVSANATPYPSRIFIAGLTNNISKVTVTLKDVNYLYSSDIDLLLVGPHGETYLLVSDAGNDVGPASATQVSHVTLTLDDAAATAIGQNSKWGADGTAGSPTLVSSKPFNYATDADTFGSPAPAPPYNSAAPVGAATLASTFNGISPNGTWSLYATIDSLGAGNGSIAAGWTLTLNVAPAISSAASTTFVANGANTFTVNANGGPIPTITKTSGALPSGVTYVDNGNGTGTLSGTPASGTGGTYPLVFTASNGVGSNFVQNFTLRVVTSAPNYLASFGLTGANAALNFDYDRDGIANLLEYALGLSPTIPSRVGLPVVTLKNYSGTYYLSMTFTRSSVATDITYVVQGSSDLVGWSDLATSVAGGAMSGPGFVTESPSGTNYNVEVRDTIPFDPVAQPKRFLQLKVTSP